MTTNIGWCWTGTIPELLVIEPERLKTPKVENKQYNKRGVIDCPSYQSFYNNLFVLKSPVSFTAVPKEGGVDIESDEVDTNQLQGLVTLHQPEEMYDVEKLFVEKESLESRGLTEEDLSVDVKIIDSSEMKKLMSDSEVVFNF